MYAYRFAVAAGIVIKAAKSRSAMSDCGNALSLVPEPDLYSRPAPIRLDKELCGQQGYLLTGTEFCCSPDDCSLTC